MGFAVCHIQKGAGNDAPVTAHIGRRVHPANADQSREHLNEPLVDYPEGVEDRTAAIQHRIDTAGITRKIGTNRVRALRRDHESDIERLQRTHERGLSAKQTELDRIAFWFPDIPQLAVQADYCREVGFSHNQTRDLLLSKPVLFTGTLRSPKSGRSYEANNVTARLEKRPSTNGNGFGITLTIDGMPILQWFKQQFERLGNFVKQTIQPKQSRGRGIGQ